MDYHQLYLDLKSSFPDYQIFENHLLAPYTTLKIGGPADVFINCQNHDQFESIIKFLYQNQVDKYTILGSLSNVLISDLGLRGIIIRNHSEDIKIRQDLPPSAQNQPKTSISTHHTENEPQKYLNFDSLDYNESDKPPVLVEVCSGVALPFALSYLFDHGITGLQWFAYIPGTIGGATWYNVHGGKYHFSDYLESIRTFNLKTGEIKVFNQGDIVWDYDQSFFQSQPQLAIISVTLKLYRGDAALARATADAWIAQKSKIQSMNSAGSVFKNPDGFSAGQIIDELGWKGKSVGGAQVSEKHANFIVNAGNASAKDYYTLMTQIQSDVLTKKGIRLEPEIKLLGQF
jgi:UDP-N-acetylmuramate dehydrogenase